MIHVPATKWTNLMGAINDDSAFGYNQHEPAEQILREYWGARARFCSPWGRYCYRLDFDDSRIELMFAVKYSEFVI